MEAIAVMRTLVAPEDPGPLRFHVTQLGNAGIASRHHR